MAFLRTSGLMKLVCLHLQVEANGPQAVVAISFMLLTAFVHLSKLSLLECPVLTWHPA